MYQNLLNTFFKHRWIILIFTAILWLLAVYSASGLKINENIMDLLPDHDNRISVYREIFEKFNPMNAVFIDIALTGSNKDREMLIKSADSLYASLENSRYFRSIIYRWQIQDLQKAMNVLIAHRNVLFTKEDSIAVQTKLNYAFIEERIRQWKRAMMETPSPFLAEQFIRDPLDIDAFLQKKLTGSQTTGENITVYRGRLFNKALNHILIIGQPEFKSTDTGRSRAMINFLDEQFTQSEEQSNGLVDVAYLSAHRFSVENAARIQSDIQRTVSIALIAIILLSLLVYSRPVLMVLTLLPALFGSAFSLGLIRIFNPAISAIIIGSGAMLIGITVDYGIHFLYHLDQSEAGKFKPVSTAEHLLKPLILSAGTTMAAFLALQFSALPGYRQLGLFVMLGIFGSLLFVILILPLMVKQSRKVRKPVLDIKNIFPVLFDFVQRRRMIILILIGLLTAAAVPGFLNLEFDGDVQNLNAVSQAIQKDVQTIKNEYGNVLSATFLMLKAENFNSALEKNEKLMDSVNREFKQNRVQVTNPVTKLLPSKQRQNINRHRWQSLFDEETVKKLQNMLGRAERQFGLKRGVFDPFINNLINKSEPLNFKDYHSTLIETILNNVLRIDSSGVYILSNVQAHSGSDIDKLSQFIGQISQNVILYDGRQFVGKIVQLILSGLERIGLLAFIFVLIFMLISVRNVKSIFVIFLPLLISTFWTFSVLGWLGIKINIINSIISVFIFGLVIDYSIFLVNSFQNNQQNFKHISGGAILISALTTMIGLGALAFAGHPALHSLGVTAFIGIGCGMLIVFIMIPAMIIKKI